MKSSKTLLIVLGVLLFLGLLSGCGYNSMVKKRETVNQTWGNVQNAYQRRADLIPNLVATVQGAANFEKSTLTAVVEARSKATSIQLNADQLTPENIAKFEAAQNELKGSLSRLLVAVEAYPELKATQNFQALQAQLEGTENRINTERNNFNTAVREYNAYIASFPQVLVAKLFGFSERGYFQAAPGSEVAPKVDFGTGNK